MELAPQRDKDMHSHEKPGQKEQIPENLNQQLVAPDMDEEQESVKNEEGEEAQEGARDPREEFLKKYGIDFPDI